MKNLRHPNFILALISTVLLLVGLGMRVSGYASSMYVVIIALALGAIHWVWAIIDVISRSDMKNFQKRFWSIAVIACPILGGMLFYALHQEKDKIVT